MIDLHSHTVHSDGDRSPDFLLAEAAAAGTLLSAGDPFEIPQFPGAALADTSVAALNSDGAA